MMVKYTRHTGAPAQQLVWCCVRLVQCAGHASWVASLVHSYTSASGVSCVCSGMLACLRLNNAMWVD